MSESPLPADAMPLAVSPMRFVLAVLAGALITFFWGGFSHSALPFHEATLMPVQDESAVLRAIQQNVTQNGVYLAPNFPRNATPAQREDVMRRQAQGPNVLVTYRAEGLSIGKLLVGELATQLAAGFLIVGLLTRTANLAYWGRVAFVVGAAMAGATIAQLQFCNWYGFPLAHGVAELADVAIGWFLAGLAVAKLVGPRA